MSALSLRNVQHTHSKVVAQLTAFFEKSVWEFRVFYLVGVQGSGFRGGRLGARGEWDANRGNHDQGLVCSDIRTLRDHVCTT